MATNTKNYNLVKPAENELADINVLNKNMDVIDEQMLPVNSLVSDDSKKALAAAQGKILNGKIGDLTTLTTEHKETLVQAINEAADGAGITVVTENEYKDMQKAGTVDANKLYGIVDSYDSSAGNVAISDTLSTKLGLTADKNVEKAIDTVDTKTGQNAKSIAEIESSLLKKDGSVQMTGVLKTAGGNGTIKQIDMGSCDVYTHQDGILTMAQNCYYDGTNWRYKANGEASFFGLIKSSKAPAYWYANTGTKDSVITWAHTESILTTETGLPLTGGTLTGYVTFEHATFTQQIFHLLNSGKIGTIGYSNNGMFMAPINKDGRFDYLFIANDDRALALSVVYRNQGTDYPLYGMHNITCSTTAPTGTLIEGAQHQVYA